MKEVNLKEVINKTEELLRENLSRNTELTQREKDVIIDRVGNIFWFLNHQGITLCKYEDFYKARDLKESLEKFLNG